MDKISFNKSTKNIPLSTSKKEYRMQFIRSVNEFATQCRWKAMFALKRFKKGKEGDAKEKFGFKSTKMAPQVAELMEFESKLYDLAKDLKFREAAKSTFQRELTADVMRIKRDTKVIVASDKSANYYRMDKEAHRELMNKAIHDTYKKGADDVEEKMNKDARKIAIDLDIEDRVFKTERREAVFTLKDHKPNFANRPEVRLINPTKSELGRVSKQKLAKVVQNIKEKTGLRQFKSDLDLM